MMKLPENHHPALTKATEPILKTDHPQAVQANGWVKHKHRSTSPVYNISARCEETFGRWASANFSINRSLAPSV